MCERDRETEKRGLINNSRGGANILFLYWPTCITIIDRNVPYDTWDE